MYMTEELQKKWAPVLEHPELEAIKDPYKRAVTALVLENQQQAMRQDARMLNEVTDNGPTNVTGSGISNFDPILISLVRRSLPNLIAYDVAGVQPMTGPTGLIFAMRARYNAQTGGTAAEAFYNEANTIFSGAPSSGNPYGFTGTNVTDTLANTQINASGSANTTTGIGMPTSVAEFLGSDAAGAGVFQQMAFSIEKVTVTAQSRALKAEYSLELAQDLKAIHGLDAEAELSNILSTEILAEINREVVRTIYATANIGYTGTTTSTFNLNSSNDTSGRWAVEKFKGLLFAIERASNKIAKDTRRGKGNILIVSTDIASALAMTGLLDYNSALTNNTNLNVDDTGNTFAGTLFGRIKVYVDPYSVTGQDYVVVGYKGATPYDAGLFYCPYVPLQMVRAINPDTFQPKIGFKTRYGLVANPFADSSQQNTGGGALAGAITNGTNTYYRKFRVTNLVG